MSIFKLLLIPVSISLFSIASPAIYAADTIDVEQCTEQKRKAYPGDTLFNQRQRCMPIAAICWGWGGGSNAVYEYCSAEALEKRGKDSIPSDRYERKKWE